MKNLALLVATVGTGLLLQGTALGHGGQYRGPGSTVPPGGRGSAPLGNGPGPSSRAPTSRGRAVTDLTAWTYWWDFNKEPFLNLKAHVHAGGSLTGNEGWYLGRGQRREQLSDLRPHVGQVHHIVAPALLEALANESNNDILTGSLIALAKVGDEPSAGTSFEPVIRSFLSHSVQEVRETAAVALGILADEVSVPTLAALLADDKQGRKLVRGSKVDQRTRSFAAYGLALVGARTENEALRREAVRMLRVALDGDDTRSDDLGVACVIALGLIPLESMAHPGAREGARTPPEVSRGAQIEYLLAYLEDVHNPDLVRAHAPTALARLLVGLSPELSAAYRPRVARALLALCKRFTSQPKELVQSAVLALGAIGDLDDDPIDVEIRALLIEVPEQVRDRTARNFAMIALGQLGGDLGSVSGVAQGLSQVQTHLIDQLANGHSRSKPWAALGIGTMGRSLAGIPGADGTVRALTQSQHAALAAERSQGDTVGAYAIAAGLLADPAAAGDLLAKLEAMNDDATRGYISVALGLVGSREAIEPLREIVRDAKYRPALLKEAAIGLGLLGDKEVVLELTRMLSESKSLATGAAISSALGFIGDRRSIDPLVAMLRDESLTDSARGFAAVALGIVCDKEPLPWNAKIAVGLNYDATTATLNDPTGKGILNIL